MHTLQAAVMRLEAFFIVSLSKIIVPRFKFVVSLHCPRISGNAEVRPLNVGEGFSSELWCPRDLAIQPLEDFYFQIVENHNSDKLKM